MEKKIKLSARSKVRLSPNEIEELKQYIKEDPAAFATININTGISRNTVLRIITRGWMELRTAIRLRDFLRDLKKTA